MTQPRPQANVLSSMNQPLMPPSDNMPKEIYIEEVKDLNFDDQENRRHEKLQKLGWDTTPDNPKYNTDLRKQAAGERLDDDNLMDENQRQVIDGEHF